MKDEHCLSACSHTIPSHMRFQTHTATVDKSASRWHTRHDNRWERGCKLVQIREKWGETVLVWGEGILLQYYYCFAVTVITENSKNTMKHSWPRPNFVFPEAVNTTNHDVCCVYHVYVCVDLYESNCLCLSLVVATAPNLNVSVPLRHHWTCEYH